MILIKFIFNCISSLSIRNICLNYSSYSAYRFDKSAVKYSLIHFFCSLKYPFYFITAHTEMIFFYPIRFKCHIIFPPY